MANIKFTDLTEAPALNATDILAMSVNDGEGSRKVNIQNALKKIFTTLDANSNTIINLLDPINPQDAATRKFVEDSVSGSSFFYFFSDTADGTIPDYFLMYTNPTGEPESTKTAAIPANDTLITSFITETTQPNFTLLLTGVYDSHVHAAKTAGTQDVQIYWKLFKRDNGGVETEILTSEISNDLPVVNTEFDLHGILTEDQNLAADDRLIVKFYGNPVGVGTTPTATLYLEGTNASRVEIKTSTSVPRTFLDLEDTPTSYSAAKDIYVVNDTVNGLKESTTKIDDSVSNQITIENGTTNLTVTANSQLNQDLRTSDSPSFSNTTITNQLTSDVGIMGGSSINTSAQFQIDSTTKGFLPPRLTTTERDNISNPNEGLQIHNKTQKCPNFYDGTLWKSLCSAGSITFLSLIDTPSSYTNAKGTYVTNDTLDGVRESDIKIDDSVSNQITIENGTTNLTVTANSQLDQDLRTSDSPSFSNTTITNQLTSDVGIMGGSSIDPSAQFQIDSTTKGFLPPRMTTTQRTGISNPEEGLQVHDTIEKAPYFHNGTAWEKIGNGAAVFPDENQIYYVGANGNNSNSGKNRQNAKLNAGSTYTTIVANETPSETNRFVIYNPDAHEDSGFQTNDWINVYTPNTTYGFGVNVLRDNSYAVINKAFTYGGGVCVLKTDSGVSYLNARELQTTGAGGIASTLELDGGTIYAVVEKFSMRAGDYAVYLNDGGNSTLYLTTNYIEEEIFVGSGCTLYLNATDYSNATFSGTGTVIKAHLKESEQTYYVGKGGSDTDGSTGKDWESDRFLTFGKAITEVSTQSPDPLNRFVIKSYDAGVYEEQLTLNSIETDIDAPNAILRSNSTTGSVLNITGGENTIKMHAIYATSSDSVLIANGDSTSNVNFDIDQVRNPGTGYALDVSNGYVNGRINNLNKMRVGANGSVYLNICQQAGDIDLLGGSQGSITIGRLISGNINKDPNSSVTVIVLNPSDIYNIYHEYYMTGNTTETSITAISTPVKVAGTTTEGLNNNYFTHSNNRLTYNDIVTNMFEIRAQLSWEMVGSTSQETLKCYIYLNGTVIGKSTMTGRGDNDGDAPFIISVQCLTEISQNDYIEIWVSQESGSIKNILVNDMNVIVQKIN